MALKKSIKWGVNSHWYTYPAYVKENADEALRLAHELGSTIYRINGNPTTESELAWTREIARKCHAYGMEFMLALDNFRGTVDEVVARMTYAAENLQNEVDYFQIFNEVDCWAAHTDDGTAFYNASDNTGQTPDYYNPNRVKVAVEKMKAALDVFHHTAPQSKLVVNLGARHYPMLDWYLEAGLKWDIIGFDVYEKWDYNAFFGMIEKRYPGFDIIVTECNYPSNNGPYKEEDQAAWLETFIHAMNNYPSNRMKAVIIYELLDQPSIQTTDEWDGEAHFGLVRMNRDNTFAEPKKSYYAMQKRFCGK